MPVIFGRRESTPDPLLLAQVSPDHEVSLGTYSEAVLAVTGADVLERFTRFPGSPRSFADLDDHDRRAAMQAELDRLIAEGTVDLRTGSAAKAAAAAARAGKLPVTGPLGDLCRLVQSLRRVRSIVTVELRVSGLEPTDLPPGVPPPGIEVGYWVPFDATKPVIFLVERVDLMAGTRAFTLRTARAQFTRIASFIFCDRVSALPGLSLQADVAMSFRLKIGGMIGTDQIARRQGEDSAVVIINETRIDPFNSATSPGKESRFSQDELASLLNKQFMNVAAIAYSQPPPRRI